MSSSGNGEDLSNGWETIANGFLSDRSPAIGVATIENWSRSFDPGEAVLDVGCGFGGPYTQGLIDKGIKVYGVDASHALIQEYRKRFPTVAAKCEAVEVSSFFDRTFDGILSVGVIFLLPRENQILALRKMAMALNRSGKFLFSAPYQVCDWDDLSTGRKSMSLGRETYTSILRKQDLVLMDEYADEGGNHYYDFLKAL